MNRPDDHEPEPVGGRAAERLREFLRERLPEGVPAEELNPLSEQRTSETQERSEPETQPDQSPRADHLKNHREIPG